MQKVLLQAQRYKNQLVILLVLGLGLWLLRDYLIFNLQIILGLLCTPFVFKVRKKNVHSWRYGIACLLFAAAYFFLGTHLFLFFACGCLVFFSIELLLGKNGILPFLFLITVSPALYYMVTVFTFSLRLQLSQYAAQWLNAIGMGVKNQGSYFILPDGFTFSVDTACVGLNMFCTGLCLTVLMIGFAEQRFNKHLGFFPVGLIAISAIGLLLLSNLLRIVALVLFRSMPGTFGHEFIGIFSMVVYMAVPVYFLTRYFTRRFGKVPDPENPSPSTGYAKKLLIIFITCILIVFIHVKVGTDRTQIIHDQKVAKLILTGYDKNMQSGGVAEFRSDKAIVYVKPAVRGFESDHSPAMCWRGSGFELVNFNEKNISGRAVMWGKLQKDQLVQYTAWWYDNGKDKTINQWTWRLSRGEPYRIINLTTTSEKELEHLCRKFLRMNLFQ